MPQFTVPLQGGGSMTVNASDAQAATDNVTAQGGTPSQWGGPIAGGGPMWPTSSPTSASPSPAAPGTPGQGPGAEQYGGAIQKFLDALASGNREAFQRAVYEFDKTFGLTEAGVTGTYQGAPTLPALTSYATQFGQWGVPQQGAQTLAAQQQQYAQQLGLINQAATLQANPFRQQQAIGQMGNLLGGQGVAGFSAPNAVQGVGTAGGNTRGGMGYLSQMIDDIRDPSANQHSMQDVLNGIPTPNKLNSNEFMRAAPSTQSMVLQGMQEKYGLDPNDALTQIKATLPSFQAPTTMGTVRR